MNNIRKKINPKLLIRLVMYILLLDFAFIYLYPFLHMVINALKNQEDLMDISVKWVINEFYFENFKEAAKVLNYFPRLLMTVISVALCTAGHVLSCSFIGYGFARYNFKGKNFFFALLLLSMIVPTQTIIVPLYILYSKLGMIPGHLAIILPTWLGFGLKGAIFVFIFRQFFLSLPPALEEASAIDGCGAIRTFFHIALPVAKPTVIVCSVLSAVWHWNDMFEPMLYVKKQKDFYLSLILPSLQELVEKTQSGELAQGTGYVYTGATVLAASVLIILPLFIGYMFIQRKFVQSIETSGITGE